MAKKVILTYDIGPAEVETKMLAEADAELIRAYWTNEDNLIKVCADSNVVAILVGPNAQITKRVIDAAPNLKILSRLGIGIDNIDIEGATARSIPVSVVLDYCVSEVADHAMAFILTFARRIVPLSKACGDKKWIAGVSDITEVREPISRLSELTLGIVGSGRIGATLVSRAKAFSMKVIISDPYLPVTTADELGVKLVDSDQLLAESDFISIHAPLTDETRHLFTLEAFKKMKSTAFLINNARGPIVDERALYTALNEGYIAGAGLDVTDPEPPSRDNPLLTMENVMITGHSSWYSRQSVIELSQKSVAAIVDVLNGRQPATLANPEVIKEIRKSDQ